MRREWEEDPVRIINGRENHRFWMYFDQPVGLKLVETDQGWLWQLYRISTQGEGIIAEGVLGIMHPKNAQQDALQAAIDAVGDMFNEMRRAQRSE